MFNQSITLAHQFPLQLKEEIAPPIGQRWKYKVKSVHLSINKGSKYKKIYTRNDIITVKEAKQANEMIINIVSSKIYTHMCFKAMRLSFYHHNTQNWAYISLCKQARQTVVAQTIAACLHSVPHAPFQH